MTFASGFLTGLITGLITGLGFAGFMIYLMWLSHRASHQAHNEGGTNGI
jgi:hypothetical protein